jgi:hypothetical protein
MTTTTTESTTQAVEHPETDAPGAKTLSDARLRANRLNAGKSSGPKTAEGKKRSSVNATRHGLLAQTLHLPDEEIAAYHEFTAAYVKDINPIGFVETQLAHTCADLQFRLNRIAAAEHNLFSIGHAEQGDLWEPGHSESHTALAFAETIRNCPDPLKTLSIYEQRISRRFTQTLKQLLQIQADRRAHEKEDLEKLSHLAIDYECRGASREAIDAIDPIELGFVCSKRSWQLYRSRKLLPTTLPKTQKAA